MAAVQKQFEQFHEAIRTDFDTNAELREKRDIILDKIEGSLAAAKRPAFDRLMQGSYIMRTGVLPVAGREYDIDVGLRFRIDPDKNEPDEVRSWVWDAVQDHTKNVAAKGPCIRVTYSAGFHVDLVAYACWEDSAGATQYRLAHDPRGWVSADPPKLLKFVADAQAAFADTEGSTQTSQLRRLIRYLKRWDDIWQPDESDAKPSGLAFTLLSIAYASKHTAWDGKPDDHASLRQLAAFASSQVRLSSPKPTPEYEDLFAKLSDAAMTALVARFGAMRDALDEAQREPDPSKACARLADIFGPDFPIPPPEDTGKKTKAPAIITSSASG